MTKVIAREKAINQTKKEGKELTPREKKEKKENDTVRERDSMEQKRMTYEEFLAMMYAALEF